MSSYAKCICATAIAAMVVGTCNFGATCPKETSENADRKAFLSISELRDQLKEICKSENDLAFAARLSGLLKQQFQCGSYYMRKGPHTDIGHGVLIDATKDRLTLHPPEGQPLSIANGIVVVSLSEIPTFCVINHRIDKDDTVIVFNGNDAVTIDFDERAAYWNL